MVMPSAGTFQYKAIVPVKFDECSWPVQPDQPIVHTGDSLHDSRLVGACPCLRITDSGPTPNPSSSRPEVLRSRFTLTASERQNASVSSASFYVEKDLTSAFQPGDTLHMARTGCAGIALSLLRNGHLVFAAGAISAVPLGNNVTAALPLDLIEEANVLLKGATRALSFKSFQFK